VIFRPVRYRPLFGRILTIVVTAFGAVAVGGLVVQGSALDVLRYGAPTALVVLLCWALFWLPELRVEEHAVIVRNILRTHHIPWPAIERIDTKYALTLYTAERRITVWVAPAPSRVVVPHITRNEARFVPESAKAAEGSVRPGDIPTTESGAAARAIRVRWEQLRDDGVFDRVLVPQRIRTEWHPITAAAIGVLLVATVVGLAL
jgi:hypothetical protein